MNFYLASFYGSRSLAYLSIDLSTKKEIQGSNMMIYEFPVVVSSCGQVFHYDPRGLVFVLSGDLKLYLTYKNDKLIVTSENNDYNQQWSFNGRELTFKNQSLCYSSEKVHLCPTVTTMIPGSHSPFVPMDPLQVVYQQINQETIATETPKPSSELLINKARQEISESEGSTFGGTTAILIIIIVLILAFLIYYQYKNHQ